MYRPIVNNKIYFERSQTDFIIIVNVLNIIYTKFVDTNF